MDLTLSSDTPARWLPVPGWETTHLVSDDGQVRSLPRKHTRGRVLARNLSSGYWSVSLAHNKRVTVARVHCLVVAAFIGPRPPGHEVRHLNGDPLDARACNLAYGTRSDNVLDAVGHGTHSETRKTHCTQGHPYDAVNTYVSPGRPRARYCRACIRVRTLARRDRRKQVA